MGKNPSNSPLETALKQLQAWFVEGAFEKVKKGAEEVLQVAPNNSIAQDLLKKAEEAMGAQKLDPAIDTAPAMEPFPTETSAVTHSGAIPDLFPSATPLTPQEQEVSPHDGTDSHFMEPSIHHGHSLAINIAILIGLIGIGIGLVYGYNALFKKDAGEEAPSNTSNETTSTPEDEPAASEPSEIDKRNEERLAELSQIEKALIGYYERHKHYPPASEVNAVLVNEGFLPEVPTGPTENEIYIYAVYTNELGENQVYILTALFENPNGSLSEWTTGGSIQQFPEYRDLSQENVVPLHPTLSEEEVLQGLQESEPESVNEPDSVNENPTEESTRVPRT